VHPAADLVAAAMAFAARLAAGPTMAIRESKALIDSAGTRGLADQLQLERAAGERCSKTRDHAESLKAAVERRDPVFQGT
jgi:2-(1,2-epoxy-1,2-dihydrophenyl)acetyl-CoA isomerase